MGEKSAIEWTDASWNPWYGCTKVSPGCDNCYMFRDMKRYGRDPEHVQRSKTKFTDPLKWEEPRRIFTCSWSDWFHKDADPWRDEAWDVIRRTPQHTYQILTKRPGRIHRHLPKDWGDGYPNVWLGTSVENGAFEVIVRAVQLARIPARVRFLSCEPLIGSVSFDGMTTGALADDVPILSKFHWIIAGGESGPNERPMKLEWARTLRDEAAKYDIPFFFKQLGGSASNKGGGDQALLDGRRHVEFPRAA